MHSNQEEHPVDSFIIHLSWFLPVVSIVYFLGACSVGWAQDVPEPTQAERRRDAVASELNRAPLEFVVEFHLALDAQGVTNAQYRAASQSFLAKLVKSGKRARLDIKQIMEYYEDATPAERAIFKGAAKSMRSSLKAIAQRKVLEIQADVEVFGE